MSAANDTQNHFNFTIDATGTDAAHIHQSTPVELIVGFNFVINNNSAGQTITAGQTASYNLDVVPLGNGSVFPGNVSLSCGSCRHASAEHAAHSRPARWPPDRATPTWC